MSSIVHDFQQFGKQSKLDISSMKQKQGKLVKDHRNKGGHAHIPAVVRQSVSISVRSKITKVKFFWQKVFLCFSLITKALRQYVSSVQTSMILGM